jgi:hypothetical protein
MASMFQRKKGGAWWIKYYVNGRQVYYSLGTKDARVAKRVKCQIEGEEAKGELLAPSKTPLPAFLEDFCKFLSTVRTRKSYLADVSVLRVFFGPICPSLVTAVASIRGGERGRSGLWRTTSSPRINDTGIMTTTSRRGTRSSSELLRRVPSTTIATPSRLAMATIQAERCDQSILVMRSKSKSTVTR